MLKTGTAVSAYEHVGQATAEGRSRCGAGTERIMGRGTGVDEISLEEAAPVAVGGGHKRGLPMAEDGWQARPPGERRPVEIPGTCGVTPTGSSSVELLIRLFDIVGSLAILFFTVPVMAVAALCVKLTSRGPILYRQERVGKGGVIFTLYKFRTMVDGAERHVGPVLASRDDQRVTAVGRFLRRMRLDELPQLYNILRGDMSLVGPRPERPYFVARHQALQGLRLAVKPGLTGLAQVRSFYDLKPDHKARYDCLYIQKRSLLLNLYILVQTIPTLFTRKGW
jgi:lipopolysaccharide/colanic/teichoic acid biosynthesis glycosyltransferase